MRKLISIAVTIILLAACNNDEHIEPEPDTYLINYSHVGWENNDNPDSLITLPLHTRMKTSVFYNIPDTDFNHLSYIITEQVNNKVTEDNWKVTQSEDCGWESSTYTWFNNLETYADVGDTIWFIVNLLRQDIEPHYTIVATDTLMIKVIE